MSTLLQLAQIGAEHRHWDVTDGWVVVYPGHNDAPYECKHADCLLVREPLAASSPLAWEPIITSEMADIGRLVLEEWGEILDNESLAKKVYQEMERVRTEPNR